jgi:nucleotide-binding universal stress UspA family protein
VFEDVVVGASDSAGAARAVRRAIEVAQVAGGTVHIVAASGRGPAEPFLAEYRQWAATASVRVETHQLASDAVDAITQVATEEGADLIVVGSRGERGTRHLSRVPKAVMDRAACAVLVV